MFKKTAGSTLTVPLKGEDWNYYADSLDVKISCDYDYSKKVCNFKFTAIRTGMVNVVLKTKRTDGRWNNIPVSVHIYEDMTMRVMQNADIYITDKSYTAESAKQTGTDTTVSQDSRISGGNTPVSQKNTLEYPIPGTDWTYFIDSLNVKVSCDFDYNKNICNFKITGVKPGKTNIILKTQRGDGKWNNTPVSVVVNSDLSVTISSEGAVYVTSHSYTE